MILSRRDMMKRAYNECLTEMYAKAQPYADFNTLIEEVKNGNIKDDPHDPVYNRYYLSYEEFHYILEKYNRIYGFTEQFTSDIEIVEDYFNGKGRKDVWIPDRIDNDGFKHPGYRSSEEVPHINDNIKKILSQYIDNSDHINYISNDISNLVFEYLDNCKNYYRFDIEEQSFNASVALGCSPTSNKETVIEYWKNKNHKIEIEDRNPLLFYEMDEYGENFEEYMKDDYGEDWKEIWWKKYYETNDGKKKLVNEYFKNNDIENLYIITEDENLFITTFKEGDVNIPIDDYMKNNNIVYDKDARN